MYESKHRLPRLVIPTLSALYGLRQLLTVLAVCALLASVSALTTKTYLSKGLDRWAGGSQLHGGSPATGSAFEKALL